MSRITPFLWFDGQAEAAIRFYTSVFKNSKVLNIQYWPEGSPFASDQVMASTIELDGQRFHLFDAGPDFKFTEAISFFIAADTQEEIDYYWEKMTSGGGSESMCGWVKDQFGVSWQVVPQRLGELLGNTNKAVAAHAMQALMKMKKIIIADLERAAS